jgi:hypothetical protein
MFKYQKHTSSKICIHYTIDVLGTLTLYLQQVRMHLVIILSSVPTLQEAQGLTLVLLLHFSWLALRREAIPFWNKAHCRSIHAITLPCGSWSIIEDVAQMSSPPCIYDLDPGHEWNAAILHLQPTRHAVAGSTQRNESNYKLRRSIPCAWE